MNKHILADIVTEKLKRTIGIIAKPIPQKLMPLEKVIPSGKQHYECALYSAEKLKKISIIKTQRGDTSAGSVIMIVGDNEYDLPFILVAVGFVSGEKSKIAVEFEAMPLIKDEESTRKYIDPFRKWRESIGKLPSEPITGYMEPGEIWKANLSPTEYLRYIPIDYTDEVLNLAQKFFDIFLDIYQKAVPVKDAERRKKMDAFRSEFNKRIIDEDPDGVIFTETFGRQIAELFYNNLIYL